ncbi:hypothetical protein AKJ57_03565 [candidate division MSBL1 archaeon SCGC-AAA259A05]|uniref:Uncharacterized protein n=1 Tax=candidate division MSBL1 archaeon SCGC-AAA259A05 TaxID=1698259 RepID=A0A133U9F9_9EURY|nr:hypothetical protein AKJ57_03565 [candidate division MSBL1 archaeon SCGC-AAA259A05]
MDAIIFDLDGVLINSEKYWDKISEKVLNKAIGPRKISSKEIRGLGVMDQYDFLSEDFDMRISKKEFFKSYNEEARRIYEKAEPVKGLNKIISFLEDKNVKTAIASSSCKDWVNVAVRRLELGSNLDEITSVENIDGKGKPFPEIYLHTSNLLGVEPQNCIVVEDSEVGVKAAKNAGMCCIGSRFFDHDQNLTKADEIVDNSEELFSKLREKL